MKIDAVLKAKYPADLVDSLLDAYREIEQNYFLGKWKASELDSGHFVEAARRMIEHALFASHTPIGTSLPGFNDSVLRRYEGATGDHELRILIPRALWSVYGVRNTRGVGHLGKISPNHLDSAFILGVVKWVLAEFVRLASGLSTVDTEALVESIIRREVELLWKHEDVTRVLDPKMSARDQVMLLLYDTSPQQLEALRNAVEYANPTNFRKIVRRLHDDRLVELMDDGRCVMTATGILAAEAIARRRLVT